MKRCLPVAAVCALVWTLCGTSHAASITNPGFEVDGDFTVWPGYNSGNGPTTAWNSADPARTGVNGAAGPFADNGSIPEAAHVAFVQSGSSASELSTIVTGLVPGTTYRLKFRANARSNGGANLIAGLRVSVDGSATSPLNLDVQAVGGSNPYYPVAYQFVAPAASAILRLANLNGGNDNTLLIDAFSAEVSPLVWGMNPWTDDLSSQVNGAGAYTHAINLGTGAGVSVNGIAFTGVGGGNPAVGGSFSLAGFPNPYNNDLNNNISGTSEQLSRDFVFGLPTGGITLDGLTVGQDYMLQLFTTGWQGDTAESTDSRGVTLGAGPSLFTLNLDQYGVNDGTVLQYRYTASGSSETIPFQAFAPGQTFHLHAFANAAVPEPGTLVLLFAGLGTIAAFRRFRKR